MDWQVYWSDNVKRLAILVGKQAHCLQDLLWRWQAGEFDVDIAVIVSNHPTLETLARDAGIPFHVVPIEVDGQQAQEENGHHKMEDIGPEMRPEIRKEDPHQDGRKENNNQDDVFDVEHD